MSVDIYDLEILFVKKASREVMDIYDGRDVQNVWERLEVFRRI
jgi:hypothetical protein